MKRIVEYELSSLLEEQELEMTIPSRILSVEAREEKIILHVLISPKQLDTRKRKFRIYEVGQDIQNDEDLHLFEYLGMVRMEIDGIDHPFTLHIFYK